MGKICTGCNVEKPTDMFFKNSHRKDGLMSACKQCCANRTDKWRRANARDYNATWAKRSQQLRQQFYEWKSAKGCYFCGETFPNCLELHHLDPTQKDFAVHKRATGNWNKFLEEAKKCVVVCSNCHKKIHYGNLTIDVNKQYIFD